MKNNDVYKRIRPLIAYYKNFGTISSIKQNDEFDFDGERVKIGWIIANLRQDKKKGLLAEDLVDFLNYMGMSWNGQDFFDNWKKYFDYWYLKNKTLSNLNQYTKMEYNGNLINIGEILSKAREYKRKNILKPAQIEYLDMLGIVWAPKDREVAYEMLIIYKNLYGSIANIKSDETFVYGDKICKVGKQINHLRTRYNKGLLTEDEIAFFEDLGMVWTKRIKKQDEMSL